MILIAVLFVLTNVAYVGLSQNKGSFILTQSQLCAVPRDRITSADLDMATVFFQDVFGNEVAPRIMSGVIALSLFGNIVVMTFTASRGEKLGLRLSV